MNHTPPIHGPTIPSVPRDRLFIVRENVRHTRSPDRGAQVGPRLAAWIFEPLTPIFAPASRRTSAIDIRHSARYGPS